MKLCRWCQQALYSRGEPFKVIRYYGPWDEAPTYEEERCEWCGEQDKCDEVEL